MKAAPALRACPREETLAPTFLIYGRDKGLQRLTVLIGQFPNIEAPLVYAAQQLQYFVARLFLIPGVRLPLISGFAPSSGFFLEAQQWALRP